MNARFLGTPVLRVLSWGWIVLVIVTTTTWVTGRLEAALPLTGLTGAVAAVLLVTPTLLFLVYALRHPPAEIPFAMRRAAVESGATLLVVGTVLALSVNALEMGVLFVVPVAMMALLGVVALSRVLTLPAAAPLPQATVSPSLRHRGATISGAVTLLLFAVLAPKVLGGGSRPGRPTEENMRRDLRTLVAQQDGFFAEHQRYANLRELDQVFQPTFSQADVVLAAESTRFVAAATSPRSRLTCLVWTGLPVPPTDSVHGAEDGVPVCWER